MPEELAIEPVETEPIETEVDANAEPVETDPNAEPVEADPNAEPVETATKGKANLATIAKTHREALKALDPSLPGLLRDVAAREERFRAEFPGGLREAVATRDAFAAIGGAEGIQEYQTALQDYGALEQMFERGDKQFIERLAAEGPEQLSIMMPAGLEQWKKVDAEFYNHNMAKVLTETMGQHNALGILQAAWAEAKEGEVKNALAYLWEKLNGYAQTAAKAPDRKITQTGPSDRENQLAEREMNVMMAPVMAAGDARIKTVAERELSRQYQWANADADVKDAVLEKIRTELGKQLGKNKAYTEARDRMKQAGNIEGLKRHIQTHFDKAVPTIIQRVAKLYNLKPRSAGTQTAKKAATVTPGVKTLVPEKGWVRVSAPPNPRDVDRSKTNPDMVLDNRAIMKDGRKVYWP